MFQSFYLIQFYVASSIGYNLSFKVKQNIILGS